MQQFLKAYIPVAEMIARTFGKNCEAVIHDLTQPESSVVYVANGSVTGRCVGQSFDHLIRQVLLNKEFKDDCTVNYIFETEDGRKIKSSAALLRNAENEVLGMLCVNYDLSDVCRLQAGLLDFMPEAVFGKTEGEETVVEQDVSGIIDDLIDNIVKNNDVGNLKRRDNVAIIRFMDEKGVFLVKGAIDKVAASMGLSKVTIYSYLDEVRGKKAKGASDAKDNAAL